MTSNAPAGFYDEMLEKYRSTLDTFIGPTQVLSVGETLQVKDYSKFDWTFFDADQRVERREKVFPEELQKAFQMGEKLLG